MRDYVSKINKVGDNIEGNDTINAGEFNSISSELKNILISAGIPFGGINVAGEDIIQNQVATAIFNIAQKSNWWDDASTQANNIILNRADSIIYPSLPFAGQRISWVNAFENTAPPTIKVGTYNSTILKTLSGQDLPSQALLNNNLYNAVYDGDFWRLEGVSSVILTGLIYMGENQGNSLECNGLAISRITYARLFAKIGTKYGVGDGSTTFNLPNLVNRVPRGVGNLIADAELQEDDIKTHLHTATTTATTNLNVKLSGTASFGGSYGGGSFGVGIFNILSNSGGGFSKGGTKNSTITSLTGNESNTSISSIGFNASEIGTSGSTATTTATTSLTNTGIAENRVKALGVRFWIYI